MFTLIYRDGTVYTWYQSTTGTGEADVTKVDKVTTCPADPTAFYNDEGTYLIYIGEEVYVYNDEYTPYIGSEDDYEYGSYSYREEKMPNQYYVPGNVVFETENPTVQPPAPALDMDSLLGTMTGLYWRPEYYGDEFGWPGYFRLVCSDGTVYGWYQSEEGSGEADVSKIVKMVDGEASGVYIAGKSDIVIYTSDAILVYDTSGATPHLDEDYEAEEGAYCYKVDTMPEGYYVPDNVVYEKGNDLLAVTKPSQ